MTDNLTKIKKALAAAALIVLAALVLASCGGSGEKDPAEDGGSKVKEEVKKEAAQYTKGTPLWIATSMIGKPVTDLIGEVGTLEGAPDIVPTNDGGSYEGTYRFEGFTAYTYADSEKAGDVVTKIEPDESSEVYRWSLKLTDPHDEIKVVRGRPYTTKDEVAKYIYEFKMLPTNYITKKEAWKFGWKGGALKKKLKGKSIGGDRFGNREGKLPEATGRVYTECDIDTAGKKNRGAKRIVFSNDGVIFYTEDHYKTFTKLYG